MSNWIGHILHIFERRIEARMLLVRRQGRRCRQIRDDREETRGCWNL